MKWHAKFRITTLATILTTLLGLFALGFAGLAVYTWLSNEMASEIAAMLTALLFLSLAIIVMLVAKFMTRQPEVSANEPTTQPEQEFQQLLDVLSETGLMDVIETHPGKSAAVTLGAGLLVGYSPKVRRLLKAASQELLGDQQH